MLHLQYVLSCNLVLHLLAGSINDQQNYKELYLESFVNYFMV